MVTPKIVKTEKEKLSHEILKLYAKGYRKFIILSVNERNVVLKTWRRIGEHG